MHNQQMLGTASPPAICDVCARPGAITKRCCEMPWRSGARRGWAMMRHAGCSLWRGVICGSSRAWRRRLSSPIP